MGLSFSQSHKSYKALAGENDLFAEFVNEYIQIQTDTEEAPWCMSLEMLAQAYGHFLMTIKNLGKYVYEIEETTLKRLEYYMSHNDTIITTFGLRNGNGTLRMTITGIRLKRRLSPMPST